MLGVEGNVGMGCTDMVVTADTGVGRPVEVVV